MSRQVQASQGAVACESVAGCRAALRGGVTPHCITAFAAAAHKHCVSWQQRSCLQSAQVVIGHANRHGCRSGTVLTTKGSDHKAPTNTHFIRGMGTHRHRHGCRSGTAAGAVAGVVLLRTLRGAGGRHARPGGQSQGRKWHTGTAQGRRWPRNRHVRRVLCARRSGAAGAAEAAVPSALLAVCYIKGMAPCRETTETRHLDLGQLSALPCVLHRRHGCLLCVLRRVTDRDVAATCL